MSRVSKRRDCSSWGPFLGYRTRSAAAFPSQLRPYRLGVSLGGNLPDVAVFVDLIQGHAIFLPATIFMNTMDVWKRRAPARQRPSGMQKESERGWP
jgi:hypothetical protein